MAQSFGTGREPVVSSFIAWGNPGLDASASGQLHFDVVLSEEHEHGAEVSEHPVEQGVNIVDHVRPLADRVELEVFVSNTPIFSDDAELGAMTIDVPQPDQDAGFLSILNGGTSGLIDKGLQKLGLIKGLPAQVSPLVMQFAGDTDYVQNAMNTLDQLRITATLLEVHTPRHFYSNMILERNTMHRDAGTGTGANFTLSFRNIRVVSSAIVDAPQPSIVTATPTLDKGKKDTAPAPTAKESVLKWLSKGGLSQFAGG